MSKKTIVFDFDGVIHRYNSGWQGATMIPDPPVEGIPEAIRELRAEGYEVIVVSTRCAESGGVEAIKVWLEAYGIEVDGISAEKPPALVYVDDRAICFDGIAALLPNKIKNFKVWWMKMDGTVGQTENEQIVEMATCKRCIHKKICTIQAFPDTFENTEWSKKPCDYFKEVKRGEWKYHSFFQRKCSRCGIKRNWMRERWYDFCPRCGADMRGKKNER